MDQGQNSDDSKGFRSIHISVTWSIRITEYRTDSSRYTRLSSIVFSCCLIVFQTSVPCHYLSTASTLWCPFLCRKSGREVALNVWELRDAEQQICFSWARAGTQLSSFQIPSGLVLIVRESRLHCCVRDCNQQLVRFLVVVFRYR